jgi:hypothetical protein
LAQGCPVLGTENTSLPDLGPSAAIFTVAPGAIDELTQELERLSKFLPGNCQIRIAARECALRWPWALFRKNIRAVL